MSTGRVVAVAAQDLRLLRRDLGSVVTLVVSAIVLIAFMRRGIGQAMGVGANGGSAQVVPGMAVMFTMFLVGNTGFGLFREHGWHTWDRLRAVAAPWEIMLGKAVVPFVTGVVQLAVVFVTGWLLFGFEVRGTVLGLALVVVALSLTVVALSFAVVAMCRTVLQVNAVSSLGTVLLAGIGGALLPLSAMPGWAARIAPATPTYWAMRGFRHSVAGGGLTGVLPSVAGLLAFAGIAAAIAALRWRMDDTKSSFA